MRRFSRELWLAMREHTDLNPEQFADLLASVMHSTGRIWQVQISYSNESTDGEIETAKQQAFAEAGRKLMSSCSSVVQRIPSPGEAIITYELLVLLPDA